MKPPQLKLALFFAKFVRSHGQKVLHANNVDLLTRDLGQAMMQQKHILSDPRKNSFMTAYDVLPVMAEVKVMSLVVAKKLDIPVKGRSVISVLDDIVKKSDERNNGQYAGGIKQTLEWTRELFSRPELQDVMNMGMTDVDLPKNPKEAGVFFKQLLGRSQDELTRVAEFLKHAKGKQTPMPKPQEKPKDDPKPETGGGPKPA
ncbi:MAG: hypothetical protein OXT65_10085 [Alphaproteobacteria bacterium]|nr:hypothetical protein [Alphaproteobacteria bacterium]